MCHEMDNSTEHRVEQTPMKGTSNSVTVAWFHCTREKGRGCRRMGLLMDRGPGTVHAQGREKQVVLDTWQPLGVLCGEVWGFRTPAKCPIGA